MRYMITHAIQRTESRSRIWRTKSRRMAAARPRPWFSADSSAAWTWVPWSGRSRLADTSAVDSEGEKLSAGPPEAVEQLPARLTVDAIDHPSARGVPARRDPDEWCGGASGRRRASPSAGCGVSPRPGSNPRRPEPGATAGWIGRCGPSGPHGPISERGRESARIAPFRRALSVVSLSITTRTLSEALALAVRFSGRGQRYWIE